MPELQEFPNPITPPLGTIALIYALNSIATSLQASIQSESNVFSIFQQQVVALGLRGGISLLDDSEDLLVFQTVAYSNPIQKILGSFEKKLKISAKGYAIQPEKVDVYRQVVRDGRAVFVSDTSSITAQVVPKSVRGVVKPLLSFLGQPPGIFAPLVYSGKVKGMLNIVGPNLTEADIPTMQAFANQIAVALENARLMNQLQSANKALETAYQKTLEGWVKALELRDQETEGHTIRMANVTVQLAEFMGIPPGDLHLIQKGALLHDIGKMAIPDNILLKPAPLDESEWVIMKQHPVTAYDWLKGIEYLGTAVDIPHYHHEHWDGSGYPLGLHGEEIPLSARIFTVVDIWDAMLSDRPYRQALSPKETLTYIEQQSGRILDPRVKNAFFDLLSENPGVSQIHSS